MRYSLLIVLRSPLPIVTEFNCLMLNVLPVECLLELYLVSAVVLSVLMLIYFVLEDIDSIFWVLALSDSM